jgi:hypothetical protein
MVFYTWIYCTINQISTLFFYPPLPPLHTAFVVFPYAIFISRYSVFWYSLPFSFPLLSPLVSSNNPNYIYTHTQRYIWSCMYFCICIYLLDLASTYEGKCALCPSEPFYLVTSLSMMVSNSIHLPANNIISFFLYGWIILHCIYIHIFLIHSSVVEHLGLASLNTAAINMGA